MRDVVCLGNSREKVSSVVFDCAVCLRDTEDRHTGKNCSSQAVKEQRQRRIVVASLVRI